MFWFMIKCHFSVISWNNNYNVWDDYFTSNKSSNVTNINNNTQLVQLIMRE